MHLEPEVTKDVIARLRRARGQIDGIIAMVEAERPCADIVTQVAAASKALDRAGFKIVANGMMQCLREDVGPDALSPEQMEKLFLSLA